MSVSIEKKKAEAVLRMRQMGVYGNTIRQFEKEGYISRSEPPLYAFYWVEGEELERIRRFEKDYNALVYMVIRSCTTLGVMDSYLYVSDYEEEWEMDPRTSDVENPAATSTTTICRIARNLGTSVSR